MDYKIIVILLVLLFLIVMIYREITTLKDQVDKNIITISSNSKQTNDRYESTLQHNMDRYLSQIKSISTDNLQQLKKITLLNHQPIIKKKTSNHFTENDSDARSETKSHLQHFSDVKATNNKKIFDNQTNSYYYSDRVKETKPSEDMSNNAEQSPKHNTKHKLDDEIPIYEDSSSEGSYSVSDSSGNDNNNKYQIDQQFITQHMEDSINGIMFNAQQFVKPFVNSVLNDQQHMINVLKTKINNNMFDNNMFQTGIIIHMDSDINDESNESGENYNINNVESISSSSVNINPQICNSQYCILQNNNTQVVEPVVEKHFVEPIVEEKTVEEQNVIEEQIVEPNVEERIVQPVVEEQIVEPVIEEQIVEEPIIQIISKKPPQIVIDTTKKILKSINEYTLNDLKTIAKQLSIPTTYKHQNRTKQYNKEDLYNNIKIKY